MAETSAKNSEPVVEARGAHPLPVHSRPIVHFRLRDFSHLGGIKIFAHNFFP